MINIPHARNSRSRAAGKRILDRDRTASPGRAEMLLLINAASRIAAAAGAAEAPPRTVMAYVSVDSSCWSDVPGQKGAAGFLFGSGKAAGAVNAVSVDGIINLDPVSGKLQVSASKVAQHKTAFMGKGLRTLPMLPAGSTSH